VTACQGRENDEHERVLFALGLEGLARREVEVAAPDRGRRGLAELAPRPARQLRLGDEARAAAQAGCPLRGVPLLAPVVAIGIALARLLVLPHHAQRPHHGIFQPCGWSLPAETRARLKE
jgi:hypothetical protein